MNRLARVKLDSAPELVPAYLRSKEPDFITTNYRFERLVAVESDILSFFNVLSLDMRLGLL